MHGSGLIRIASLPLIALCLALAAAPADGDKHGTLVLKVNGKDVTLETSGASYGVAVDGDRLLFDLDGDDFILSGEFDLSGDGRVDGKDKPKADHADDIDPKTLLNKPIIIEPTDPEDDGATIQNHIELPGMGDFAVLKGSTATVVRHRKGGGDPDRWSGTIKLNLKPLEGKGKTLQVEGRFECGVWPI